MRHEPVLKKEVIDLLKPKSGDNAIDCTLGDGGHAESILVKTAPTGRLLGIDADPESLLRAKQYLYKFGDRVEYVRDNFVNLNDIVKKTDFSPVNRILMDFGWSSPQFEDRGRGFSFQKDEPLDMRFSTDQEKTASDILNTESLENLESIFREFGEEKLAKKIAKIIFEQRETEKIKSTKDLVNIVFRANNIDKQNVSWAGGIHPATRVFQALRMAVNEELDVIKKVLPKAIDILAPGGRLAIISFHSLEDRIVKHFFKSKQGKKLNIITKKPITPDENEIKSNPRSRSAKLRVVEKI